MFFWHLILLKRKVVVMGLATGCLFFDSIKASPNQQHIHNDKNVLYYNVDLALSYHDRLTAIKKHNNTSVLMNQLKNTSQASRSLGLKRSRFTVNWLKPQFSEVSLIIRPDALPHASAAQSTHTQETAVREFDSRSGDTYYEKPVIEFLDAYTLTRYFGQAYIKVGVREYLQEPVLAYEPELEFGLAIRWPQRFMGSEIAWVDENLQKPTSSDIPPPARMAYHLWVFSGDQDRVLTGAMSPSSYDRAPEMIDPHYALALQVDRLNLQQGYWVKAIIGRSEDDLQLQDSSGIFVPGSLTRMRTFWGLAAYVRWAIWDAFPTLFAVEWRYDEEKWQHSDDLADSYRRSLRLHRHASITAKTRFHQHNAFLWGTHWGSSQLSEGRLANGYQLDLGFWHDFGAQLAGTLMISYEQRQEELAGIKGKVGGFVTSGGARSSFNQRLALSLRYLINDDHTLGI